MNGTSVKALVDSGNLMCNVISEDFLRRLAIPVADLRPVGFAKVGSAKKGAAMEVLGQVPKPLHLRFAGLHKPFPIQPLVLRNLSMPLNISGPYLKRAGIDQLHSKNALSIQGTLVRLEPPQRKGKHPAKPLQVYTIEEVTVPPNTQVWTRGRLPAVTVGAVRPAEGLLEGSWATEENLDIHLLRNAIVTLRGEECPLAFLNTTTAPLVIPEGTLYGTLTPRDDGPEGIYHVAPTSSNSKDEETKLQPWQTGPTTKDNYQRRSDHLRELFHLDRMELLADDKDKARILAVLVKNYEVFSLHGEYGRTDLIEHDIDLVPGARPLRCPNRPVNPALEADLHKQILKWLKHNVIEPTQSPWSFPLVPVKKKTGDGSAFTIRWCVDFRRLNSVTVPDAFAIGDPSHNLAQLAASKVFSTIDASGAFHQISVTKDKRELTAFSTPWGQFAFRQLPFGVSNGPSTYARLIARVLEGIPPSVALGYIDDVLVHSPTVETHADGLDRVLTAHRNAGLKLNPAKCTFVAKKVEYLGHLVSGKGLEPIPAYTQLIKNWPLPRTRTALRAFLGKVNYYRKFLRDFAKRAAPLLDRLAQDGTKDKAEFTPSSAYKQAFEDLRTALISAPILGHPRFNDPQSPFIVDCDWSALNQAIGAVLSQVQDGHERVIAYGGTRLPESRARYAPQKGELFALLHFCTKWSYFLRYQRFIVRTDHSSLTYLKTMSHPDYMVQRWLSTLANFQFDVQYRKGEKHGNADALSRAPHLPAFSGPEVTDDQLDLCNVIASLQQRQEDMPLVQHLKALVPQLRSLEEARKQQQRDPELINATNKDLRRAPWSASRWATVTTRLQEVRGAIFTHDRKLAIPAHLQAQTAKRAHELMSHRGAEATVHRLGQSAAFPAMTTVVRKTLQHCHQCATKSKPTKQRNHLHAQTAQGPFDTWSMDFVGPLPTSTKGFKYILTLKCLFTRWVEAFPTKDMLTTTVIKHLVNDIFSRFGLPTKLHSDNGTNFTSHLLQDVCAALSIKKTQTPPYNPKSNSVERFHRDLVKALTALTGEQPATWPDYLPLVLHATRCAPARTTGLSPFEATFGRCPPTDVALFFPFPNEEYAFRSLHEYARDLRRRTQATNEAIARTTKQAILARACKYRGTLKSFPTGSKVYLFTPVTPTHTSSKFANVYWSGPHEVVKKLNDLTYQLKTPSGSVITTSIDRLRPYGMGPSDDDADPDNEDDSDLHSATAKRAADKKSQSKRPDPPPCPDDSDDDDDGNPQPPRRSLRRPRAPAAPTAGPPTTGTASSPFAPQRTSTTTTQRPATPPTPRRKPPPVVNPPDTPNTPTRGRGRGSPARGTPPPGPSPRGRGRASPPPTPPPRPPKPGAPALGPKAGAGWKDYRKSLDERAKQQVRKETQARQREERLRRRQTPGDLPPIQEREASEEADPETEQEAGEESDGGNSTLRDEEEEGREDDRGNETGEQTDGFETCEADSETEEEQ